MAAKHCKRCDQTKPLDAFTVDSRSADGRHYKCKACVSAYNNSPEKRAKRREYMRRNNLTDASDFTETWKKAAEDRAAYLKGEKKIPGLRDALGRAMYQQEMRQRRK